MLKAAHAQCSSVSGKSATRVGEKGCYKQRGKLLEMILGHCSFGLADSDLLPWHLVARPAQDENRVKSPICYCTCECTKGMVAFEVPKNQVPSDNLAAF
eukprot:724207-Pelagomonas_calceolata.AAC.4